MNSREFRKLWKGLAARAARWVRPTLPALTAFGLTRRALMLGGMAAIAVTGPAQAFIFSGGSPANGGGGPTTIDTMTLKTKSGSNIAANQPFEFGLPIAPGTVAQTDKIQLLDGSSNVLTVQEDNRIIDANGDVRFCKVTCVGGTAPGAASETITIQKLTGTPDTSNPITIANLLAQTISADTFDGTLTLTLPDGTVYTAKCSDGLNASTTWAYGSPWFAGYNRQGPLCTEFICVVPFTTGGTPHAYLNAEFHIMAYKALPGAWNNSTNPITGVKIYFFVQNGYVGLTSGWANTPVDYVYDLVFSTGASSPVNQLSLTGGSTSGNLTLGGTSGQVTATRASGTFGLSTSAPNSSDCGKAIVELSGSATGRGYICQNTNGANSAKISVPTGTPFTGTTVTSWKTMGVYHYYASRVSNTHPAIGGNWWGTNSDLVYPILNTSYIKASAMMPNYWLTVSETAVPDLTQVNRDGCHPCGMSMTSGQIKNWALDESATGDVDHIGVMTYQQANACIYWNDATNHANARTMLIANAELGHRKPMWWQDDTAGTLMRIDDSGIYRLNGGQGGSIQLATNAYNTCQFTWAVNHSGQANYFAYLVTGDLYHLQGMYNYAVQYSVRSNDYGITNVSQNAVTVNTATDVLTGPGTLPQQTGESVNIRSNGGGRPNVNGSAISNANVFYYRALTGNTGNVYDTRAHALAGGATGLINFTSTGSSVYLLNGYNKNCLPPGVSGAQVRTVAWCGRSIGQGHSLFPTNPISAGIVAPDVNRTNGIRRINNMGDYLKTQYVDDVNYQAGGPRFLAVGNGTTHGIWQRGYLQQAMLNILETAPVTSGSTLGQFLDWYLADVNQWHVRTSDSYPAAYCSHYYFVISTDISTASPGPAGYDYATLYNAAIGAPFKTVAYAKYIPGANITANVTSVANPAAVTVTLSAPYFDTSNKVPYEGKAWVQVGNGFGQIVTISSSTVCIIDCTVTTWYGVSTTNATPITGSGQTVTLPLPSPGNASSVIASGLIAYFQGGGMTTGTGGYGPIDRASIEITKQRSIDTSNYTAAVAEMTGRSFPANLAAWGAGNVGVPVKFGLVSRI